MLKTRNDKARQKMIWESILPKELFELDEELKKVDEFLDNDVFMQPFEIVSVPLPVGQPSLLKLFYGLCT